MYSRFQLAAKYVRYCLAASNGKGHGTHSPFVYDFITRVLSRREQVPAWGKVESLRRSLLHNHTQLEVEDFGAGSAGTNKRRRTVASVAARSAKPRKYGQLLYRMVKAYQPARILELGTSLGITTAYLSLANPRARIITLEGAGAVADLAGSHFSSLGLENIELVRGNFDETLKIVLGRFTPVDFVFIDGNHRYEPTTRYFQQLLPATHEHSILVFDDIHWSAEMEAAWETIKAHAAVTCSVDLFFIGIVFFRTEFRQQQHFTIRF